MHGNSWFLREDTGGSWPRKMRRQSPWETRPRTRAPPYPRGLVGTVHSPAISGMECLGEQGRCWRGGRGNVTCCK